MTVRSGDRFIVVEDHDMIGASQWRAPFSGTFECTVPVGTILVAHYDQVAGAEGFVCIPEDYQASERTLVPAEDRLHPKFDGYHFVLRESEIGSWFQRI